MGFSNQKKNTAVWKSLESSLCAKVDPLRYPSFSRWLTSRFLTTIGLPFLSMLIGEDTSRYKIDLKCGTIMAFLAMKCRSMNLDSSLHLEIPSKLASIPIDCLPPWHRLQAATGAALQLSAVSYGTLLRAGTGWPQAIQTLQQMEERTGDGQSQ